MTDTMAGEAMARRFHEAYERLAPSFGYATREDTKAFDPKTPNGRLMIAVCNEIAAQPSAGAQSYVRNCLVKRRADDTADFLFIVRGGAVTTKLDGYAIIPSDEYDRLIATPAQPDTGDVAALREALLALRKSRAKPSSETLEFTCVPTHHADTLIAALSKPNAQGATEDGGA